MRKAQTDFPRVAFYRIGYALGVKSPDYQFQKGVADGVIKPLPSGFYRTARGKRLRNYARKNGIRRKRT
jgi:hypothetical protein